MKKASGLFMVLAMMVAMQGVAAQAAMQKYDIKSGIVTMESVMNVGTMEMKFQYVVYFDEYGMKECKETYKDGKLADVVFSDGKTLYALKPGKQTAFKRGGASRGTELRMEFSEMGSQKDRDSGKVKKIAPMLVAGKLCEAIETNDGSGTVTQYADWKKIMVYMKSSSASVTTTIRAIKIEENVAVPAAKFQVPDGYVLK
jgi:outer membrane lipoprotein-sorting protein